MAANLEEDRPALRRVGVLAGHAHFRLATGEQLLAWAPRDAGAAPLPLMIYLHGASSRGDDVGTILTRGPDCVPQHIRDGAIAPDCSVVAPLLGAKSEWCRSSAEATRLLRILDAYVAAAGADGLPSVDRSRVYCARAASQSTRRSFAARRRRDLPV